MTIEEYTILIEAREVISNASYSTLNNSESSLWRLSRLIKEEIPMGMTLEDCSDYVEPDFIVEIKEPFK